jgi:hypothetical protein
LEGIVTFDLPPEVWKVLKDEPDLLWEINKRFIDDMIEQGKAFVITVGEGKKIGEGLAREQKYLDILVNDGILTIIGGVYVPIK